MYKTLILLVLISCLSISSSAQERKTHTISGYITAAEGGELLFGANIYCKELGLGTSTNTYGFYSLTLPEGSYTLQFSYIGLETKEETIQLASEMRFSVMLATASTSLQEVVVTGSSIGRESEETQMSKVVMPVENIQDIPTLLGEKDVLKSLQLLPGVQSGSEGSAGLYVRGGGPDQNLIILDDAIVYNANHLFGFFSVFNGDAIKSVELYKGGFPARFGGRLSSVVKMDMKDGNKDEVHGKFGIGLISSSLMLEGPIKKNKTSFVLSARRTYADLLARPLMPADEVFGYYFGDLTTKIHHIIDDKNKLYISGYFGRDKFYGRNKEDDYKFGMGWGNYTSTLRWNHQYNAKLFSNTSFIFSHYDFTVKEEEESDFNKYYLSYSSKIRDLISKIDFDYFLNPFHSVKFGLNVTQHRFSPNALVMEETGLDQVKNKDEYNSIETAIYLEDEIEVSNNLSANTGFRVSNFNYSSTSYFNFEPRLALAYRLASDFSVKSSFAMMNQYIHLLTNSGVGLPTDLWVSSTDRVKPQSSWQLALGLAKDKIVGDFSVSLEGYYKKSDNIIGYKEGASFLIIDDPESSKHVDWQENITDGTAWSYGVELLLRKHIGRFTGWLGYTWSKTEMQFDELNFGRKYLAKYDRRHDVSVVGIYKPNEKFTLSANWVYGTGNRYTLPVNKFKLVNRAYSNFYQSSFSDYNSKNNFLAEAYHRFDISFQFHKEKKRGTRTWELSVYNAYNRNNPFFYYIQEEYNYNRNVTTNELRKVSLFPLIPSVTYKLEF